MLHTLPEMLWNFKKKKSLLFVPVTLFLLLALSACQTTSKKEFQIKPPHEAYYKVSFDKAWRAIQIAMVNYPIEVNNMEKGFMLTKRIAKNSIWKPVHTEKKVYNGDTYQLKVVVVKGSIQRQKVVKIKIIKTEKRKRDFFSATENIKSSGIEEELILYRIKREILADRLIEQRAQNTQ